MPRDSKGIVRTLTTVLAALVTASTMPAQPAASVYDAYLSSRSQLGQFNGTVLVARQGKLVFAKGYGEADFQRHSAATVETKYAVASLTKMFTSAAILALQQAGKLKVSDHLCAWYSECPTSWKAVTLEHLMQHRSGIPDYEASLELGSPAYQDFMAKPNSAKRIEVRAAAESLVFVPGSRFEYSNTGYILLGRVIERASGMSYEEYVTTRILRRARMTNALLPVELKPGRELAVGYHRLTDDIAQVAGGMTLNTSTLGAENPPPLAGPHGDAKLVATANDLWKWSEALADSSVLSGASVRAMFSAPPGGYGFGWMLGQRFGIPNASHNGLLPGFESLIERYPESGTTIVILSNVAGTRLSLIARDIAAITFGKPYDLRTRHAFVAFDSAKAAALNGRYQLSDGREATVTAEHEMLRVSIPGRFNVGGFALGNDTFYVPFFENVVRFSQSGDGTGTRIVLRLFGEDLSGVRRM